MINSKSGYEGDIVFSNQEFPDIAPNDTGNSVVSLSSVVRIKNDKLRLYRPKEIGYISIEVANTIIGEVETSRTLTRKEKTFVLNGLNEYLAN